MKNETTLIVPTDRPVIRLERSFDAPRPLVWQATTTPELVKRWWAPSWTQMITCEIDLRLGGVWRFVLQTTWSRSRRSRSSRRRAGPSS